MTRRRHYNIPVPTWRCPHCRFIHRPADLLRLNNDDLQCRQCGQAFPAVPAKAESDHPAETESQS
jgi:rubredoxin